MSNKKIVILDGPGNGDEYLASPFSVLIDLLEHDNAELRCYHLKEIKLAHCTGCFGCWVKTPGICVSADKGREIVQSIIQSDITILFTPVTFGGYSSTLKIIVDRFIPIALPFFGKYFGETHHTPRYSRYPRLLGIGVQRHPVKEEAELFKTLVGRNAINFHAPTFAADVVSSEENKEMLIKQFQSLHSRSDPMPFGDITSFLPKVDMNAFDNKQKKTRNALLIVGSPKIKNRSTSGILGEYLLEVIKSAGWKTEMLTLKGSLNREKGQAELCSAVDRSGLIILAFPLYIDALPYLVTKAFEVIAKHKKTSQVKKPQCIFTLINNGFPESHQNALALAICRCFADQCSISWAGSLAMGAGEALGGGQDLAQAKRSGPPVKHVIQALDRAGAALVKGSAVPLDAQRLISKTPIPAVPFGIWRWMFTKLGEKWWIQQAAENDVRKQNMYVKPYADETPPP